MTSRKEIWDKHSRTYAQRVADPLARWLRTEEWIVVEMLRNHWHRREPAQLVVAACGTGHRLLKLLTEAELPRDWFTKVVGLDFSSGMLEVAATLTLDGRPLFDELILADLTEEGDLPLGDVVLCLWSVPNLVAGDAPKLLSNLARMVEPDGLLIYDIMTSHPSLLEKFAEQTDAVLTANPELERSDHPRQFWRQNTDGTAYDLRLFTADEILALIQAAPLDVREVWGYMHSGLGVGKIEAGTHGFEAAQFSERSGLMICHGRST